MKNKYKIYLDTCVISYIKQEDTPERMRDTLEFFDKVKLGLYEVYISDLAEREYLNCKEPKRTYMKEFLANINYKKIDMTEEAEELAIKYIKEKAINQGSIYDARHIALATVNRLNAIASWNFKHIVNYNTMEKVNEVNNKEKYSNIFIVTPKMLNENGGDGDEH